MSNISIRLLSYVQRAITVYIHKSVLILTTILIAATTLSSVAVVAKECNSNDDHNKENNSNDDSKTCANGQGSKNHYATATKDSSPFIFSLSFS